MANNNQNNGQNNQETYQNGNGNRMVERLRKRKKVQKIDKIVKVAESEIKSLHIGVLCNVFEPKGKKNLVEQDLTKIGIASGPHIKGILNLLHEARLDGKVKSKQGEEDLVNRWLDRNT